MTLPPVILLIEYCSPAFHLLGTPTHSSACFSHHALFARKFPVPLLFHLIPWLKFLFYQQAVPWLTLPLSPALFLLLLSAFLSQRIAFQSFRDGFRRITLYPSEISPASFSQASFPAWLLSRHRKTEVIWGRSERKVISATQEIKSASCSPSRLYLLFTARVYLATAISLSFPVITRGKAENVR